MKKEYCHVCGKEVYPLPYICKYCGKSFCVEHRLPEKHQCENLQKVMETAKTISVYELAEEIAEFEEARKESIKNPFKRFVEKFRFRKK